MPKPNIILIMTDQQRYDTINALGASWTITPHLDRLAREGTVFTNVFCTAPSCVPSRASFFNGYYPHTHGVYHNGSRWEHSWVEWLQRAGYHCVNIGKMHTVPHDAPCGFDQRFVVENKVRPLGLSQPHGGFYDEWDKFLANCGVPKPSPAGYKAGHPLYETALGAYAWELDPCYHADLFVGNMAAWFLEQRRCQSPLFLQIGFPGPHPPYDPVPRYIELYEGIEPPVPMVTEAEVAAQPLAQQLYRQEMVYGNHDGVRWQNKPPLEQLRRLWRYYAASVTMIDEQIGLILACLERKGYLDDAVVIFTSDHGDCLGEHGQIQKWTMYDCITHVPMIVSAPGRIPAGERNDALLQQMDVAAALLALLGMEIPDTWDARPMALEAGLDRGRKYVFAEHPADNVWRGAQYTTMIRSLDFKLVHYAGQEEGELYDLRHDPGEVINLWDREDYGQIRRELLDAIRDWRLEGSIRAGQWRK